MIKIFIPCGYLIILLIVSVSYEIYFFIILKPEGIERNEIADRIKYWPKEVRILLFFEKELFPMLVSYPYPPFN